MLKRPFRLLTFYFSSDFFHVLPFSLYILLFQRWHACFNKTNQRDSKKTSFLYRLILLYRLYRISYRLTTTFLALGGLYLTRRITITVTGFDRCLGHGRKRGEIPGLEVLFLRLSTSCYTLRRILWPFRSHESLRMLEKSEPHRWHYKGQSPYPGRKHR